VKVRACGSELRSASPFGMPLSRGELRRCGGQDAYEGG
jgi:hypothetical protein